MTVTENPIRNVSRCLTDVGVEHAVLERGRIAQRWRTRIDDYITAAGLDSEVLARVTPTRLLPTTPISRLHAGHDGIAAVVWATGYRRSYPWLDVPVLGSAGETVQRRGVTAVPGLFVVGQRFQHRRDANFLDGVRHDISNVALRIAGRLNRGAAAPPLHGEGMS